MSFLKRQLEFTFQLGLGTFGDSGEFDTLTVSGLRATVALTKVTGHAMGTLNARIFGLTRDQLAKLSTLNRGTQLQRKNVISVSASTEDSTIPMATIFQGEIAMCQIDMAAAPDSALVIVAYAALYNNLQPAEPTSYKGNADVGTIMQDLATRMGYTFENHLKAPIALSTPYFSSTLREQAQRCVDAANINWAIDTGVLAIWDKLGSRGGSFPLISPAAGLIGYPTYAVGVGIGLTTMFNPFVAIGETIEVDSSLDYCKGRWNVFNIDHSLESETPDGEWFTRFVGSPYNVDKEVTG